MIQQHGEDEQVANFLGDLAFSSSDDEQLPVFVREPVLRMGTGQQEKPEAPRDPQIQQPPSSQQQMVEQDGDG